MPERTVQTKFFEFRQNNSGGHFDRDGDLDVYVIVEALNAEHANTVAESHGVYFDGCDAKRDCPCCGDRWHRAWRDDSGTSEPLIDEGIPIEKTNWDRYHTRGYGAYVYYLDGRKEHFGHPVSKE